MKKLKQLVRDDHPFDVTSNMQPFLGHFSSSPQLKKRGVSSHHGDGSKRSAPQTKQTG